MVSYKGLNTTRENITGELYDKRQLSIAMEVLDKLFTEAVDFSRQGYLATDF